MPNKVIILEGPDGAGKTTLADSLVRFFDGVYTHEGPPNSENLFEYYSNRYLSYLCQAKPVICDRFHLGETIYGPVARGVSKLSKAQMWQLNSAMSMFGTPQIICLPPYKTAIENYQRKILEKDDYLNSLDKYKTVYWMYSNCQIGDSHIRYDYTVPNCFTLLLEKLGVKHDEAL